LLFEFNALVEVLGALTVIDCLKVLEPELPDGVVGPVTTFLSRVPSPGEDGSGVGLGSTGGFGSVDGLGSIGGAGQPMAFGVVVQSSGNAGGQPVGKLTDGHKGFGQPMAFGVVVQSSGNAGGQPVGKLTDGHKGFGQPMAFGVVVQSSGNAGGQPVGKLTDGHKGFGQPMAFGVLLQSNGGGPFTPGFLVSSLSLLESDDSLFNGSGCADSDG